ncbi:hypothetical protein ABFV05_007578 [Capra hircus]
MAWIGGSKPHLCFLPLLLFYPFSAKPGDAHSLCYNFTVNSQPRPGQPWCVVQGQVDGKIFLSYDCGRAKIQFTSPLGEEVKTTKAWETQTETLRDVGDLLREQLPDVTSENHRVTDPLTLQGRMTCRCEEDGHISLHGRLSGLASGFLGALGGNVDNHSITNCSSPQSQLHGHSHQAHHLDPPRTPHQFHHNCLPGLSPFQEQEVMLPGSMARALSAFLLLSTLDPGDQTPRILSVFRLR